jgi:hypothetical protein
LGFLLATGRYSCSDALFVILYCLSSPDSAHPTTIEVDRLKWAVEVEWPDGTLERINTHNLRMSRMLTLLDIALAASARAGKDELILLARRLWASGYQDWLPISTHWEGIANKLALAIEINGAERAEMIADEAFANSYCPGCSMPLRKIAHNPRDASFRDAGFTCALRTCYQSFLGFRPIRQAVSRFDRIRKTQIHTMSPRRQKPKKKQAKVGASHATTRSTAGPGFAFEDQIGAYLLLQMLMGETLPGSDDSIGSRLQTQTKALHWSIDDLLATGDPGLSTQRQLAVSCKSSHQVTASGFPKDFVSAAWDQWSRSKGPMNRDRDSLMLATRGHHPAFEPLWTDIKNSVGGDSKVALARIGETANHRKLFASIKNPVKSRKRNVSDAELVRFARRLEVMATDFDMANSEDQRKSIARCRSLINGGKLADGRKLWNALVAGSRKARLGHGTIEIASLVGDFARQFDLKDHPNYESSWKALEAATTSYKNKIEVTLPNQFAIGRQTDLDTVSALVGQEKVVVLYGESGCGKSALVKNVLDQKYPEWRQVWLGPDQLSAALSELDRAKLNIAHPLATVLKSSSKPANVSLIRRSDWRERCRTPPDNSSPLFSRPTIQAPGVWSSSAKPRHGPRTAFSRSPTPPSRPATK